MKYTFSQHLAHFFHVISNIRPVVWMGLYVCLIPIFALIYWWLPDNQFRIPDGGGTDYGSWLYYSIVTITTLGFGDYTPALAGAQAVTAVEVACGIVMLGFFLNAVGAMKTEIDVESEIEKQKMLHHAAETEKLQNSVPMVINSLNIFLAYCYAVTTPLSKRSNDDIKYDPDFRFNDMVDLFEPTGLPFDRTTLPAVERLMHSAAQASLVLDSLQQRIDLTLWPQLLEDCFAFVANFQMFSNTDLMFRNPDKIILSENDMPQASVEQKLSAKIAEWNPKEDVTLDPDLKAIEELFNFIKDNGEKAMTIETLLSELALQKDLVFS